MPDETTKPDDVVDPEPVAEKPAEAGPTEATPPQEAPASAASDQGAPAVPTSPVVDTGYTASGVPTFDSVREKIETRYGTALGAAELAGETPEGRSVEDQYEARQKAAAERLAQIRESMRARDHPS